MESDKNSGILPAYVHALAERSQARKIIDDLERNNLSEEEQRRLQAEIDDLLNSILLTLADAPDSRQDKAILLLNDAKKAVGAPGTNQDLITARRKVAQAEQISKRWESEKKQAKNVFWIGLILTTIMVGLLITYLVSCYQLR
jgi:dGTP triphosphohydrolase